MGLHFPRQKRRNLKLKFLYKLNLLLPLPSAAKLRLLLDLAWIFGRMAHDEIYRGGHLKQIDPDQDFLLSRVRQGWKILDLGCGTGNVIRRLLHRTTDIIGVDHNSASTKKARNEFERYGIRFECGEIASYISQNSSQSCDVIILSHIFEHVEVPECFLESIRNIAQYLYIDVPDVEAMHLNIYRKIVKTDLVYSDEDHIWEFDRGQLRSILKQCNLEILAEEYRWGVMKFWCRTMNVQPVDGPSEARRDG